MGGDTRFPGHHWFNSNFPWCWIDTVCLKIPLLPGINPVPLFEVQVQISMLSTVWTMVLLNNILKLSYSYLLLNILTKLLTQICVLTCIPGLPDTPRSPFTPLELTPPSPGSPGMPGGPSGPGRPLPPGGPGIPWKPGLPSVPLHPSNP